MPVSHPPPSSLVVFSDFPAIQMTNHNSLHWSIHELFLDRRNSLFIIGQSLESLKRQFRTKTEHKGKKWIFCFRYPWL